MLLIKLDGFIYINYDLTAILHDRILENPVLVLLGGVESYAKELAYPFEATYIFVLSGLRLFFSSFCFPDDFFELRIHHNVRRNWHFCLF